MPPGIPPNGSPEAFVVAVPVRVWPVTMAVSVTDPPRAMLAALSADAVVVPGAEGC